MIYTTILGGDLERETGCKCLVHEHGAPNPESSALTIRSARLLSVTTSALHALFVRERKESHWAPASLLITGARGEKV